MDRLCEWVHCHNELGPQDPFDQPRRNGLLIALSTKSVVCRSSAARRGRIAPKRSFRPASPSLECGRSLSCAGGPTVDIGSHHRM